MKMKKVFLGIVVGLIACGAIVVGIVVMPGQLDDAREASALSSCKSISAALVAEIRAGNPRVVSFFAHATEERQFLTPEQCDELMAELAEKHELDAPRGWKPSEPLADLWGNRIEVGYRLLPDGRCGLVVLSRGRDGVRGTDDGISAREFVAEIESTPEPDGG